MSTKSSKRADIDETRSKVFSELGKELRAYQAALDAFDEAVSELLGINRTDMRCLDLLSLRKSLTAGALARAAGVTTGAITFVLDRMERAGFVQRHRDENDRRRVLVEMIPTAQEFAWKLHQPLAREMRARFSDFDRNDLEVIREFLRIGREVYEKHAKLVRLKDAREVLRAMAGARQTSDS